jgi:hypothetical protein
LAKQESLLAAGAPWGSHACDHPCMHSTCHKTALPFATTLWRRAWQQQRQRRQHAPVGRVLAPEQHVGCVMPSEQHVGCVMGWRTARGRFPGVSCIHPLVCAYSLCHTTVLMVAAHARVYAKHAGICNSHAQKHQPLLGRGHRREDCARTHHTATVPPPRPAGRHCVMSTIVHSTCAACVAWRWHPIPG